MTYTFRVAVQEEDDGRWSAWIDALPGCAAWGYTQEGAVAALRDGTKVFVECLLENGQQVPNEEIESVGDTSGMRVSIAA